MPLQRAVIVGGDRRAALPLEVDKFPTWYRIARFGFTNFNVAATTVNADLTGFPGGVVIEGAFVSIRANFTGGGAASAMISVGTVATPGAYVAPADAFAGAVPRIFVGVTIVPGTFLAGVATPLAAGTVRTQLVASVNGSLLTAGRADVFLKLAAVSVTP